MRLWRKCGEVGPLQSKVPCEPELRSGCFYAGQERWEIEPGSQLEKWGVHNSRDPTEQVRSYHSHRETRQGARVCLQCG